MDLSWSDVGAILAGIAAGAVFVNPAVTFARRPRLELTADKDQRWTRTESDGNVYVRALVHCSRLTRGARGARVMVESYRPEGWPLHMATTLGGTPSLGWPSAQDGTDGSLTVHPGATRTIDVGALTRDWLGAKKPDGRWHLRLTLAGGLTLTDGRDVLEPGSWVVRLLVVADDAKTRTYDLYVRWGSGGASDAEAVRDELSVRVESV